MNIGAVWLKEKDGKTYMSCKIQTPGLDLNFAIFKNEKKEEGSKQPDYNIAWSPPRKQDAESSGPAADDSFSDKNIPF